MDILGIESSCDETAAAVVRDGHEVLSSVVYTQIPLHQPYGGVVPEIASRAHVEKISGVVREALRTAGKEGGAGIDAVAVTYGPGLASSLIVGLAAAKGLALALDRPLIGVNHIEAHLHSPFLEDFKADGDDSSLQTAAQECGSPSQTFQPFNLSTFQLHSSRMLGLVVSGGHTSWVDMPKVGEYKIIGQTLDDAAGEAFDKAAKLLGLGYPGGPVIDRMAKGFWNGISDYTDAAALKALSYPDGVRLSSDMPVFPKGSPRKGTAALSGLDADLCVSFSGLKTSLLRHVQKFPVASDDLPAKARLVAAYQEAIVGSIADRTRTALRRADYKALVVGGGVSLNARLRARLGEVAAEAGVPIFTAQPKYCGDNAAMIAGLAFYRRRLEGDAALAADVSPSLEAGE